MNTFTAGDTIMAGICDECDSIVSTPTQSTPTIRDAMVQVLEVKTI